MDISDKLSVLKSTAREQLPLLDTRKKSETALLLPFFGALGYHPFDVREVEPEFSIEVDEGRERKVDYAAKKGGSPAMLFQVEEIGTNLDDYDPSALLRFLRRSEARVGAVTDGIEYRFYADLEGFYAVLTGETTAEEEPFLTFNLLDYSPRQVEKLRRLAKPEFKAEKILAFAHHLKYARLFREYLQRQREAPDQAFVRFIMEQVRGMEQVHEGDTSEGDVGMYEPAVREALWQLMGKGGGAQGQSRGGKKEEKTEGGKPEGGPRQSERAPDEEEGDRPSEGDSPTRKNFEEFFRERLGR
jgi:hypothetical protein